MSKPFHGQTAGFVAKVIENLPRSLTAAEMQHYYENPALLRKKLEIALCSYERVAWNTVLLEPRSGDELKEAFLSAQAPITVEYFPETLQLKDSYTPTTVELVTWSAKELGLDPADKDSAHQDQLCTLEDVHRFARLLGLGFCTREQALATALVLPRGTYGHHIIPYTTGEGLGGMLWIYDSAAASPLGWERTLSLERYGRSHLDTEMVEDRLANFQLGNPTLPLILVKSVSGLDTAPLSALISEALCEELGIGAKLRTRIVNALSHEGVHTLADVMKYTHSKICRVPNLGNRAAEAISAALARHNLSLPKPEQ